MNCPFCGTENTDDSLYCKKCGRKMSGTVTCPACGASAPADGEYCTRCGAKLNTHAPAQAEREKPHPAAWRQVLVTVGNALAVFAALASVIFLFCLGCENGITDTGDMWLDLSGRNIYYYFGEVYRDLYNIFTTSTPVLVGTAGYTFAIAGTLLSAGMIVSVSVLFILTLVRFVRSFSGKGGSVTAMAAKTYFVYLAFSLLFLRCTRCKRSFPTMSAASVIMPPSTERLSQALSSARSAFSPLPCSTPLPVKKRSGKSAFYS